MLIACEPNLSFGDFDSLNLRHSYFIKEGRISESGTHDQLLNKRGDYYEFVQLQALSKRH